jgi:hypothetical protein
MEEAAEGQLMDIGTVAAHNIVVALGLKESDVATVKQAIRDEINAMSTHFTMAVAEQQDHFESEVNRIRSTWNYVNANKSAIAASAFAVWVMGFLIGKIG